MIGLKDSILRQLRRLCQQPVYIIMAVMVPLLCAWFFITLLGEGLPLRNPTAVVDYDHSKLSRQLTRNLDATELLDIQYKVEDYRQARDLMQKGDVFGYFIIPPNFEKDALAGNTPCVEYYSNMTYFVPGTLSFKGFKTISVTTAAGLVSAKLSYVGLTSNQISSLLQPVLIDIHPMGNPWTNYNYYLTPSFLFGLQQLLIMIMTAFSITVEIKHGTSIEWLKTAKGHIGVALIGKLLPQTVLYTLVTWAIQALMSQFSHFPMNGSLGWVLLAELLFVMASQSFAAFVACILPNPRLGMSVISLLGVLTFSFAGFSFPVEQMYGAIAIFSYIVPVRYMFLIYVNTALNGFDIYFVRYYFAALLIFLYLPWLAAWNLKRACLKPVYVP
ncbi:MAG: ABC transporter permease [Bacteroidales bacterium]|nr:ABC transporter permease [Bacteroidales bacterium]